jgi:hypothetical protein
VVGTPAGLQYTAARFMNLIELYTCKKFWQLGVIPASRVFRLQFAAICCDFARLGRAGAFVFDDFGGGRTQLGVTSQDGGLDGSGWWQAGSAQGLQGLTAM